MIPRVIFLICTCLLLLPRASSQEWQEIRGPGVVVETRARYVKLAMNLVRDFGKRVEEVQKHLGISPPAMITIIIGHDARDLSSRLDIHLRPWVAGVAVKSRHRIGLNAESMRPPLSMPAAVVLRHELTHLAIGEHQGPEQRSPLWLEEGVCQWVGGTAYLGIKADFLSRLNFDDLIPWKELSEHFPADRRSATLAYLQSFSFVEFLAWKKGSRFLLDLLDTTAGGVSVHEAFLRLTGKAQVDLEKEWVEYEKRRSIRMLYLIQVVSPLSIGAILVILAFRRRKRLSRALMKRMEEEEATRTGIWTGGDSHGLLGEDSNA